jgi:diguanylate cyclase (GGDEF)-like protein
MPVLAMAVLGAGGARVWSLAGLVAIVAFTVLDYRGVQLPSELDPSQLLLLHALGLTALLVCFYVLAYVMMRFEQRAKDTLREANRWLQRESSSDALTNLANRRYFDRAIEQEWNLHLRNRMPLAVVLIDLDYFKEFNDLYGHLAGDRVLKLIAAAIRAGVRRGDVVARFGGEEFVVILPNAGEVAVRDVTERIRREIDGLNIDHPHSLVSRKVTISLGTTTVVPSDDRTHLDLVRHADRALYTAKAAGRDRAIHTTDPLLPACPDADSALGCEHLPIGPEHAVQQVVLATFPADAFPAEFSALSEAGG